MTAYIFPAQGGAALAAEYVANGVGPSSHRSIVGLALDDIHSAVQRDR
jgi:hypothetical protein